MFLSPSKTMMWDAINEYRRRQRYPVAAIRRLRTSPAGSTQGFHGHTDIASSQATLLLVPTKKALVAEVLGTQTNKSLQKSRENPVQNFSLMYFKV